MEKWAMKTGVEYSYFFQTKTNMNCIYTCALCTISTKNYVSVLFYAGAIMLMISFNARLKAIGIISL